MTPEEQSMLYEARQALRELLTYLQNNRYPTMGPVGPMGPKGEPGANLVGEPTLEVARSVVLRAAVEELVRCMHPLRGAQACSSCGALRRTGDLTGDAWERPSLALRLEKVLAAT